MRSLPLALLALVVAALAATQAFVADLDYAAPGPFTVRQADVTWTDEAGATCLCASGCRRAADACR
jgi:ABC-type proline/glycine betaine transport system substrate-binding protein